MVDRWELEWWCQEYPELTEEEILEVLQEFEEDQINIEKTD